ncbi:MAG: hydrogenase maturation nickel metallochaperone HypA [Lachnospiraceae bacterium]|nr:hydrogenase maturation nickel metallochaperone HypA [Lachnospiraceae bacterium]
MHELSITEHIVATVLPIAEKAGAKRILEIRMKIGALSGVIPSCVQTYLDLITPGTIAEGVRLISEEIPVTLHCRSCGKDAAARRGLYLCPHCGSDRITVTGGHEYYIEDLKVE